VIPKVALLAAARKATLRSYCLHRPEYP